METVYRKVSAKDRLPKKEGRYIVLYTPEGCGLSYTVITSDIKNMRYLAHESNKFEVIWLEEIRADIDKEPILTFDKNNGEMIEVLVKS